MSDLGVFFLIFNIYIKISTSTIKIQQQKFNEREIHISTALRTTYFSNAQFENVVSKQMCLVKCLSSAQYVHNVVYDGATQSCACLFTCQHPAPTVGNDIMVYYYHTPGEG